MPLYTDPNLPRIDGTTRYSNTRLPVFETLSRGETFQPGRPTYSANRLHVFESVASGQSISPLNLEKGGKRKYKKSVKKSSRKKNIKRRKLTKKMKM